MTYEFTIVLDAEFSGEPYPDAEIRWLEAITGVLYERYQGDATPAIRIGQPLVGYSVEAPSMDGALRDAASFLEKEGYAILHVEIELKYLLE